MANTRDGQAFPICYPHLILPLYVARVHNQMVQVTSKVIRGPSVCLQVRVTMSSGSKVANAVVFCQVVVVVVLALSTLSSLAPIDTPMSVFIVTGVAMVAVISS